jgi:hypothetical protein
MTRQNGDCTWPIDAFRHSYAQRHADAGTPVDVLKELMDHRSISTTMGYYQVSLKRKQAAQATDRSGASAPFSSGLAYQRGSVAVPFGGCTERPTSRPAAARAQSGSSAPGAASTGPIPLTCPPSSSTSAT